MRHHLSAAAVAAVVAAGIVLFLPRPATPPLHSNATRQTAESAYDRVMRTGTLRCGYFVWPPYFSVDPATNEKSGIYYDMIEALGKVLGIKVEWTMEYTLGQQVEALRTGKVDALCADGPWTRSAMPYVEYSHPYMFTPGYIYVSSDNPKFTDHDNLSALNDSSVRFTLMDGDGSADYIEMLFPKASILSQPSTADPSILLQNVLTGKADAVMTDPATIEAQVRENGSQLVPLRPSRPLAVFPFVVSTAKGEASLVALLDQGLDLLNDTGIEEHIVRKHDPSGRLLYLPEPRYRALAPAKQE